MIFLNSMKPWARWLDTFGTCTPRLAKDQSWQEVMKVCGWYPLFWLLWLCKPQELSG
jgi:hypothetical protein